MSGHSKWSKIKHQKTGSDAAKSQAFTKASRAITIAVREGGGLIDPEKNYRLRLAIERAREVNMPKETIERAIGRAAGEGAEKVDSIVYEAFGPGGVPLLIEVATDNRQRTVASIKSILELSSGTLASPGAVSYLFFRAGVLLVPKSGQTFDTMVEMALDAGADDVVEQGDNFEIFTKPHLLHEVKAYLSVKRVNVDNEEIIMMPRTTQAVSEEEERRIADLTHELESLDDVQRVYTSLA